MDEASPSRKPPEFHRYRLALLVAVLVPCVLLALLITASIVNALFLDRMPAARRATAVTPAEMVRCNSAVRELLEDLGREAAKLELGALEGNGHDVAAEWDKFGGGWEDRWRATDVRCRFSDLADGGLGTAYDRMAWVHRSLPRTRLKYRERMARFSSDLAQDVAGMRRALDKSRADLEKIHGQGKRHE